MSGQEARPTRRGVPLPAFFISVLLSLAALSGAILAAVMHLPAWSSYLAWIAAAVAPLTPPVVILIAEAAMRRAGAERIGQGLAGSSVRSLTGLAAWLAGSERPALRDEWRAHLAGESGHDPATWPKIRQSARLRRLGRPVQACGHRRPGVAAGRCGAGLTHPVEPVRVGPGHRDALRDRAPRRPVRARGRHPGPGRDGRLPLRRDQDRALVAGSQATRAQGQARQEVRGAHAAGGPRRRTAASRRSQAACIAGEGLSQRPHSDRVGLCPLPSRAARACSPSRSRSRPRPARATGSRPRRSAA